MADNERASQHLPPNDMNFQRNWAASVMVDHASRDPSATILQVDPPRRLGRHGCGRHKRAASVGNLKRGYAEAVRDGEIPAYIEKLEKDCKL